MTGLIQTVLGLLKHKRHAPHQKERKGIQDKSRTQFTPIKVVDKPRAALCMLAAYLIFIMMQH